MFSIFNSLNIYCYLPTTCIGLNKIVTIWVCKFERLKSYLIIYSLTVEENVFSTEKFEKPIFRHMRKIFEFAILCIIGRYETRLELKVFYTRVHCWDHLNSVFSICLWSIKDKELTEGTKHVQTSWQHK